jgi:carbamoyl-phosphate synthase large subunit
VKPVDSITALVSSGGRRVELIRCFKSDGARLGLKIRTVATDAKKTLSAACQAADVSREVPRCSAGNFIEVMLEICAAEKVTLLVPTIDTELEVLSRHAADFARIGTRVVVSSPEVVAMARDKMETIKFLDRAGVNTPRSLGLRDYREDPSQLKGPLIAKPKGGSSSIGIVRGTGAADFAGLPEADYLVQELWSGREYTVNLFFDQQGALRCTIPHLRLEVRGGEVSKGRTERVPQLVAAAGKIARALPGARGPLCFQAILTESGDYAVFEINARFGGGYPLAHQAGARFSQWLLEEVAGRPLSANDNWREGVTMLRYDAAVFTHD